MTESPAATPLSVSPSAIKPKVKQLLEDLASGLYEKDEALAISLLAAVAGESIFLLGAPGVAKSLVARRLRFGFKDGESFEYLMSRFSTPDEIFGPVSIKKLKEEDRYERLTSKYLPGASVVFLDEIWKAGPAIQNALLTVINEKVYRNGEQEVPVDIKVLIGASNELPATGEGLEALWDRFLLRLEVQEVQDNSRFVEMITDTENVYTDPVANQHKLSREQLDGWQEAISHIKVPEEVLATVQVVRYQLQEQDKNEAHTQLSNYAVSDRRWKKIVKLLRTSALLNDRQEVNLMDCFLMTHCLWNHPSQAALIEQTVVEAVRRHGFTIALNLTELKKEIRSLEEEVQQEIRVVNAVLEEQLVASNREFLQILNMKQYFDGSFIKTNDYEKLKTDEEATINIYNEEYNLVHRMKARRPDEPFTVKIFHNSKEYVFKLETRKEEKEEYLYRKPHPMLTAYWNDRIGQLSDYINKAKENILQSKPYQKETLAAHLFVKADLADVVLHNLQKTRETLTSLQLTLDKLRFSYDKID